MGSVNTDNAYYEAQLSVSWIVEENGPAPLAPVEQLAKIKGAAHHAPRLACFQL